MKRYEIDYNGKIIRVVVNDETAKILDTMPEAIRLTYLIDEHEEFLVKLKETRRHQSLEASLDGGFDVEDTTASLDVQFENAEKETEDARRRQLLPAAIKTLSKEQKWLLCQVYVKKRTQTDIAKELGIGLTAVNNRLARILKKLKNFMK